MGDNLYIDNATLYSDSYEACDYVGYSYMELHFKDSDILTLNAGDAIIKYLLYIPLRLFFEIMQHRCVRGHHHCSELRTDHTMGC